MHNSRLASRLGVTIGSLLNLGLIACTAEQRDLSQLVQTPNGGTTSPNAGGSPNTGTQTANGTGNSGGNSGYPGGSSSTGGIAGGYATEAGTFNFGGSTVVTGGSPSTGGESSATVGGSVATGGASIMTAGGTPSTAGTSSSPIGGGTVATGGASSSGGVNVTGGAPSTGGEQSTAAGTGGLAATGGTSAAASSATGGSSTGGASATTGGSSAALVCDSTPTSKVCDGVCVDVATDAHHCRVCGHDCSYGSSCVMGQCQPVSIYSGTEAIRAFDVDDTNIVFSPPGTTACEISGCGLTPTTVSTDMAGAQRFLANGYALVSLSNVGTGGRYTGYGLCPTSGCASTNRIAFGENNQEVHIRVVAASTHNFYRVMQAPPGVSLFACTSPTNGVCTATPSLLFNASSLIASDSAMFFVSSTDSLWYACNTDSLATCTSPVAMNLPVFPVAASPVGAYADDLYFYLPAGPAPNATPTLRKCPQDIGCGKTLGTSLGTITTDVMGETAIDASGVYWVSGTSIKMCPLTGCVGAPYDVTTSAANATMLRLNTGFVYWVNSSDNHIYRVAKPAY